LFSDVDKQVTDARARLTEFEAIKDAATEVELAANHQ
jgi:hypothetical protein